MHRHLVAFATASLFASTFAIVAAAPGVAVAQMSPGSDAPAIAPQSRTVNLTQEQRFIIREIVTKDLKVPEAMAGAPETIGEHVPQNIQLHDMPPELVRKVPQAKSHKFFVTADAIVLVSPSDRRVADVIKM
jgi:hypothetical protein